MKRRKTTILAVSTLLLPTTALSQSYPSKPIRWVVPFIGGAADYASRLVGQKLTEYWGQQVVIENRTGASGIIGTEFGARAAPDGYTLLLANAATLAIHPALFSKVAYDPVKSFAPVTVLATTAAVLVSHPSIPARTVKELVALAKARPGQINGGSTGNGESPHMALELFKAVASVNIVHVPYKNTSALATALLAGEMHVSFSGMVQAIPHVRAGKLRALAVTPKQRSKAAPEIPTIAESGYPTYEHRFWAGVVVPAGTPKDITTKLNSEIVKILELPDVRDKLTDRGMDPMGGTPEQFTALINADSAKYGNLIRSIGLKVE